MARTARAASLLVATDFDGTIADVVTDPELARPAAQALAALRRLSACRGTYVAILSGRGSVDLASRVPLPGVFRSAEHGAFLEAPAGVSGTDLASLPSAREAQVLAGLADLAERLAPTVPGLCVERKLAGVTLHSRGVQGPGRSPAAVVVEGWAAQAASAGLRVLRGRQSVEVRTGSHTKGTALDALLRRLPAGTEPLFAGDDQTDEDAIRVARARGGLGVYVASVERPRPLGTEVDIILAGPPAWTALLEALTLAREAVTSRGWP